MEGDVANNVNSRITLNRPFVLPGPSISKEVAVDPVIWSSFASIKALLIKRGLGNLREHRRDTGVDVACTGRGQVFRGDHGARQHVKMKLLDLVELAQATEQGASHWAMAEEIGLDYYLCQSPVVSNKYDEPAVLPSLSADLRTPSFVPPDSLVQINLWIGAIPTSTNLHFDANHNFLFILKGKKTATLLPPSMTADIQAMPVSSESPNHSTLGQPEAGTLALGARGVQEGALKVEVLQGEALFIPEGWWHQICSENGTVAVNVWFKGVRARLCEGAGQHMRPYYLRCLLGSLLQDRLQRVGGGAEAR
ncbi:unnamed protein product, partial [Discosporangium mesarthrocarpum]